MEWFDRVLAKRDDALPSFMNVDAINSYVDKSMQLDQPDMTGAETASDIALGFAPYVGTAMGYRDFERARRADDKLGMGLGILSMIPVAGGAVKAGRKGVNRIIDELDMSSAARMNRAKEMGFDEPTYYKGMYPYVYDKEVREGVGLRSKVIDTGPEITEINRGSPFPSFGGKDGDIPSIAGFFSNDPDVASKFAMRSTPNGAVYPVKLRLGRTKTIDAKGRYAGEVQFGESGIEFRDAARSGKYDTVRIINTADEGDVTVALDPANIRSVNAAFDPAKKDSANLLAGLGALGLGVGGAASMFAPQQANASDEPWYEKVLNK